LQIDKTEAGPKQRLRRLEQTVKQKLIKGHGFNFSFIKVNYFENRRQKKQASSSFSQSGPPLGKQKHFFLVKSA
jgi:hypothetical protein